MKDVPIIYEDDELVIVNKPCGLAVQGGAGISVCLIDVLEKQLGAKAYPVHRLDRDTAGLIIVAKSSKAAADLSDLVSGRALEKEYNAVCFGLPSPLSGVLKTDAGKAGREKPAETRYRVASSANGCALVSLTLITGRMHQIRMQLASAGTPIIADDKYGDFGKNRLIRSERGVRKLQLVSRSLGVPIQGKIRRFEIPLPDHMLSCLESLGIYAPA